MNNLPEWIKDWQAFSNGRSIDQLVMALEIACKALQNIYICDCEANENPKLVHCCDGRQIRKAGDALLKIERLKK